jgi:hypothetical protein
MTVTSNYLVGRKAYSRPQAMVWADAMPRLDANGFLLPAGYEIGSANTSGEEFFIIISDHNRSEINISNERIEQRQRMANGTMRSFFIADKLTITTSWTMLPSRGFALVPQFDQSIGKPLSQTSPTTPYILTPDDKDKPDPFTYFAHKSKQYTVDGGAGGGEMLDWYESHTGPFYVLLSYDKYNNFGEGNQARNKLAQYSDSRQMYISEFNYSVVKRGGNNFDMWDVSVTLEEV